MIALSPLQCIVFSGGHVIFWQLNLEEEHISKVTYYVDDWLHNDMMRKDNSV